MNSFISKTITEPATDQLRFKLQTAELLTLQPEALLKVLAEMAASTPVRCLAVSAALIRALQTTTETELTADQRKIAIYACRRSLINLEHTPAQIQ